LPTWNCGKAVVHVHNSLRYFNTFVSAALERTTKDLEVENSKATFACFTFGSNSPNLIQIRKELEANMEIMMSISFESDCAED
jgi:hypothetical protein